MLGKSKIQWNYYVIFTSHWLSLFYFYLGATIRTIHLISQDNVYTFHIYQAIRRKIDSVKLYFSEIPFYLQNLRTSLKFKSLFQNLLLLASESPYAVWVSSPLMALTVSNFWDTLICTDVFTLYNQFKAIIYVGCFFSAISYRF